MLASLVAALVSAFCYGVAAVMQAIAVRAASHRPAVAAAGGAAARVDPGLVVRMLHQGPFIASLGIDLVGFLAQLVALRRLPLFAVQAMIAANLAVTAVFAAWLMHIALSWREWLAVAGVVTGVGLLGSSAGAEGAATVGPAFQLGLITAVAGVALAGLAAARLPHPARTPVLGAVAGLGYAVLAVSARILPSFSPHVLVRDPATYTLAAAGIVSFMLYASALEGGSVTVATAAVVLAETTPPAVVGVVFLGDVTRRGLTGVAVLGFILAVVCAVALARFGDTSDPGDTSDASKAQPRSAAVGASAGASDAVRASAGTSTAGSASAGASDAGSASAGGASIPVARQEGVPTSQKSGWLC
jgi:drug/metabolite transporter (DMT)-like permease